LVKRAKEKPIFDVEDVEDMLTMPLRRNVHPVVLARILK